METFLNPHGAMPVCIPAGSAAIFDRRIWHAASPNYWTETRRVLFYGYSYRWLRFRDDMTYAEQYRDTCSPIQSQLLFPPEIWGPGSGNDLPLKTWMEENLTGETVN
jgi:ectoine hydroxylase